MCCQGSKTSGCVLASRLAEVAFNGRGVFSAANYLLATRSARCPIALFVNCIPVLFVIEGPTDSVVWRLLDD